MNAIEVINGIVIVFGIPALLGAFLQIGRKFQILDNLNSDMQVVKKDINLINEHISHLDTKATQLEVKVDFIYQGKASSS